MCRVHHLLQYFQWTTQTRHTAHWGTKHHLKSQLCPNLQTMLTWRVENFKSAKNHLVQPVGVE